MKRELCITVTVDGAQGEGKTTFLQKLENWLTATYDEVFSTNLKPKAKGEVREFIIRWSNNPFDE